MPCSALFHVAKEKLFVTSTGRRQSALRRNAVKFASKMEIIAFFVLPSEATEPCIYRNLYQRPHKTAFD